MLCQSLGLRAASGCQRGVAADAPLNIEFRLPVAGQIEAVDPGGDQNFADGRIIGGTLAGFFVQNAVGCGVHAYPEFFVLQGLVDGLIIADALHEAVQRLLPAVVCVFGQIGLALYAGLEQQRVFVDAFHKKQGMVRKRALQQRAAGAAGVGGVQNGHLAVLCQPGAGQIHIATADHFTGLTAKAVVVVVKIGLCGLRSHERAAQVAVVEQARPDALCRQPVADAFCQG